MKRELLAVTVFTMVSIGVARAEGTNPPAEAAKPPGPAPKIQFDKTVYDFGATSLVDSVTGTFTFQNAGDGELKVSPPKPSCGCTVASVKPSDLKPGEKGELVFKVNVGSAHGALEKHITVPSNDPASPNINLTIKAEMKQVVEINPGAVSVGALRQGMTSNAVVMIRRTDGKKLVISKVETSSKIVQARIEPAEGTNADQAAKLVIDVKADGKPMRFNERVSVTLEGVDHPLIPILVNGQVLGDMVIDHESLYWSVMGSARPAANNPLTQQVRRITVTSTRTDNQPLLIKNVTSSIKNLTVELTTVETGKTYMVVATLADSPTNTVQGTVSFETNTQTQPKVNIPVTIVVMGAH
ncbi:MAG TPA: DUF1573 domain-containing protein [Verrucomicrobiae bacterium]|nr:DUF1573 domain-containing protein [Verrucomicrobiae bacterium]